MNSNTDFLNMFKTFAQKVDQDACVSDLSMETQISSLGIDSVSMMEIVGEIEDELNIVIPDEKLTRLQTIGDIKNVVEVQSGKQ